ncbi:hypothetical protein [Nocardioides dubius]
MERADGEPGPEQPPSTPAGSVSSQDGGVQPPQKSPLSAYMLQGSELFTVQAAEDLLAGDCLKRFGFEPVERSLDLDAVMAEQRMADTRLYGITDSSEAARHGYQPASLADPADDSPSTSPSYDFVFSGDPNGGVAVPENGAELTSPGEFGGLEIPAGGCLGEAREKLWGTASARVKDDFAQGLRITAYEKSMADPRVQSLFAEWSECLGRRGFNYATPLDPEFGRDAGAPASEAEIATAVADIACKEKTSLVSRWNKVDVAYQRQAIEDNQLQLTEDRETIRAGLQRATKVLDGG